MLPSTITERRLRQYTVSGKPAPRCEAGDSSGWTRPAIYHFTPTEHSSHLLLHSPTAGTQFHPTRPRAGQDQLL